MPLVRDRFLILRAIKTMDKKVPAHIVDFRDLAVIQFIEKYLERNAATLDGEWLTTLQTLMDAYRQTNKLPRKKPNEDYP